MAEADVQRTVVSALSALGVDFTHIANEAPLMGALRRTLCSVLGRKAGNAAAARAGKIVGGILHGLGLKKGVHDLLILSPLPAFPEARTGWLEVKSETAKQASKGWDSSSVSSAQRDWRDTVERCGGKAGVGFGVDGCFEVLRGWGFRL